MPQPLEFGPTPLLSIATNTTTSIVYLTFVATAPLVSQEKEGVVPRLKTRLQCIIKS